MSLDWCGHGFECHSQSFLLTYPGLIKAYDILFSLFKYYTVDTIYKVKSTGNLPGPTSLTVLEIYIVMIIEFQPQARSALRAQTSDI